MYGNKCLKSHLNVNTLVLIHTLMIYGTKVLHFILLYMNSLSTSTQFLFTYKALIRTMSMAER